MHSNFHFTEIIALAFSIFVVIGTLTHELGHYTAGKLLGYNCTLHFASCNYTHPSSSDLTIAYRKLWDQYGGDKSCIPQSEIIKLSERRSTMYKNRIWFTIGGPLQTMLTGTLGLLLLWWRKKKRQIDGWRLVDWLFVYLALFWSREPFNLAFSLSKRIMTGSGSFFSGDEKIISNHYHLYEGFFSIVLGVLGAIICSYVVFKIIPSDKRLHFFLGGLIGGLLGYWLWMCLVGPVVLP